LTYASGRALRIFPGLWACFGVTLALLGAFRQLDLGTLSTSQFWAWLASQLTVVQMYNPDFLRDFGIGVVNGSLWTIPVEISFYVLLPLLTAAVRRLPRRVGTAALIGVFVGSITLWNALYYHRSEGRLIKLLFLTPLPNIHMFMLGVLVQRHYAWVRVALEKRAAYWLVGYLGLMSMIGPNVGHDLALTLIARVALAGLVFAVAFSWRTLSARILHGNDLSYGLYLYHMLVLNAFVATGISRSPYATPLLFVIAFGLAYLSWRLVERPALQLKRRTSAMTHTAATAAGYGAVAHSASPISPSDVGP
jgi:peptidoglycan/LPS O-acetylase OafA/YrhL